MNYRQWSYAWRQCDDCRTAYVWPRPPEAVLSALYGPGYVQNHCGSEMEGHHRIPALAVEAERVLRDMHGRVLDVGCGAGLFLRALLERGVEAFGVERDAATAAMVSSAVGLPVFTHCADAPMCDVVHFADVIEHHPEPLDLLREGVARVRRGGRVVVRHPLEGQPYPFLWMLKIQQRFRRGRRAEIPPTHLQRFSLQGWQRLCDRAGLRPIREDIDELHTIDGRAYIRVLKTASRAISRSPLGRWRRWGNRVIGLYALAPSVDSAADNGHDGRR